MGNYFLSPHPTPHSPLPIFSFGDCPSLAGSRRSAKSPGQNQYNNHAVDALYALYGNDAGVWDIITSSVSSSAKPAFNDAGEGNPEEWRPPAPLTPTTSSRIFPMGTKPCSESAA